MEKSLERTGLMGGEECPHYKKTYKITDKNKEYLICNQRCPYNQKETIFQNEIPLTICKTGGLVEKIIGKNKRKR
jgi:hypothetical protein